MRWIGSQMLVTARALMAALVMFVAGIATAHAQSAFYDAPASLADGPPGSLVRQEPMDGAPLGASAFRVLYRSTGLKGEPILVSGVVVVPQGPPPPGGRSIVAWAHPTSGIVPRCAPSLAIFLFQQIQGLRSMVARGYIVAATDYPGLGTPGPHPYLVGESEGRAVLDIARVARELGGGAKDFTLWGHSQGGQAVLFAGQLAPTYAPDLRLRGVAAAAPATDLATLMSDDINSVGGKNITAMTLWSWHRVYDAALDGVLDPRALPVIDRLARECIEGPFDIFIRQRTERPLQQHFLTVPDPTKAEPWRSLLEKNSAGTLPAGVPVFLAQGTVDQIIRPAVTRAYMGRLCKAGSPVKMVTLPNIGHGRAAQASTMAAVNWMTDRFTGKPAPNDCGG
ncbi:alpha/beta fold hydrolase [Bradyrhizobium japonicum]|uniref:alpha/beta fold hydrolase n=1 Tax=Bradyrhizobium japonicum TaxID=375 RepID=UPI001BACCF2D|nr:alpha/beta fold hydrolase [Bradyrhizobium japonicum]MBR0912699.1 alpha/beta fold hydrolase [Bradyrhizobium japonicum]